MLALPTYSYTKRSYTALAVGTPRTKEIRSPVLGLNQNDSMPIAVKNSCGRKAMVLDATQLKASKLAHLLLQLAKLCNCKTIEICYI